MNILCIDPGHGGEQTGQRGAGGLLEKDAMLALGKRLGNACRAHQWQITMTRIDDRAVSTEDRASRANRAPATCFISLHTCTDRALASEAPDSAQEGIRVVYQGGRGLGLSLATAVHRTLVQDCALISRGIVAAPRLDLLRWCSIPAILVELGSLEASSHQDLLGSSEGQDRIAVALTSALVSLFG